MTPNEPLTIGLGPELNLNLPLEPGRVIHVAVPGEVYWKRLTSEEEKTFEERLAEGTL